MSKAKPTENSEKEAALSLNSYGPRPVAEYLIETLQPQGSGSVPTVVPPLPSGVLTPSEAAAQAATFAPVDKTDSPKPVASE
ncbi:MAG: hypothetical protein L0Z50_42055 [Verrucomicrobiales bacterium]|nr:hypothetical protein [Verrucomicrobiales bacterium]